MRPKAFRRTGFCQSLIYTVHKLSNAPIKVSKEAVAVGPYTQFDFILTMSPFIFMSLGLFTPKHLALLGLGSMRSLTKQVGAQPSPALDSSSSPSLPTNPLY